MQPPLHSLWKQFLSALGQRARQPAYLGAHRECFTYLPWATAAIRRDTDGCRVVLHGAGRDGVRTAETSRGS